MNKEGIPLEACLILLGYLSGSVLYAPLFTRLLGRKDAISRSRDSNPGTANAFMHGGFLCGLLTLLCELSKGILPVLFWLLLTDAENPWTPLMLVAPVAGHVLPVFSKFRGGKGIAVTFGVLLGLIPYDPSPLILLAVFFLLYSLVIRISPHLQRTMFAYLCTFLTLTLIHSTQGSVLGFALITVLVCFKLITSPEPKERMRIRILWMH